MAQKIQRMRLQYLTNDQAVRLAWSKAFQPQEDAVDFEFVLDEMVAEGHHGPWWFELPTQDSGADKHRWPGMIEFVLFQHGGEVFVFRAFKPRKNARSKDIVRFMVRG